jgi:hypothetical protein
MKRHSPLGKAHGNDKPFQLDLGLKMLWCMGYSDLKEPQLEPHDTRHMRDGHAFVML